MQFLKKLISFVLVVVVFLVFSSSLILAKETPAPTPVAEISSFELFWPVVAGKTMSDSFYFVKSLKEGLREKLIFGSAQKADYSVFLATKRIVEAEKLILEGKSDLAGKTLIQAIKQLDKATINVNQALAKGISFQDQAISMSNRLSNLEAFIPGLITKANNNKESLTKILEKVTSLKVKLL